MQMLPTKQVSKMIASIAKRAAKLDVDIHIAAIQCMLHAQEHGDVTLIDRLVNSLGKSHRKLGLMIWVTGFSPIAWNGDGKVGLLKEGVNKTFVPFNIEGADETPFWAYEPSNEAIKAGPVTLEKLMAVINQMSKRIDKAELEGRIEGDIVPIRAYVNNLKKVAA